MRGELTIAACSGMRQRHLDDLDAEQRRVRILVGARVTQPGSSFGERTAGRAGDVDVDVLRVLRIHEHRVRVRAAAGLHVGDVLRVARCR